MGKGRSGKKRNAKTRKRDDNDKGNGKSRDTKPASKASGSRQVARAERALGKALRNVEDARIELFERERELSRLLVKHGRMPDASQQSVPLFDQRQVVEDASTASSADSSGSVEAEPASTDEAAVESTHQHAQGHES